MREDAGEGDDLTPQSIVVPPSRRLEAPTSPPVGGIRPQLIGFQRAAVTSIVPVLVRP